MSLLGRQIYIFLTLIFFYFYVPSGASYFYFLTSRKLYHMKFAIFDVARCRMSATSLTFWFFKSYASFDTKFAKIGPIWGGGGVKLTPQLKLALKKPSWNINRVKPKIRLRAKEPSPEPMS